ncbi:MAG: biotin--[acetyl-CoA-carboxylase] ligase [Coriobacteriales bacterium]|jgi:BirA family biotin operon repressor/biotin-[acetyl-CoA-carboxylase] ligase|nr:biotin--[acetyl-CoA-carboxylase] ligase [Coriobacteriales bacterium]
MRIIHLDTVDSTNDYLKRELVAARLSPPVAVLAEQQSAGRGQFERAWDSPPGWTYLSLALAVPPGSQRELGQMSLITALAVRAAMRKFLTQELLKIKYPNDIYLGKRKVAGILIETKGDQMVVGIGVDGKAEHLPQGLIAELQSRLQLWRQAGFSFQPFQAEYQNNIF